MTETEVSSDAIMRRYIKVNWPDVADIDHCLKFVKRNENDFYIDELVSFYLRNQ